MFSKKTERPVAVHLPTDRLIFPVKTVRDIYTQGALGKTYGIIPSNVYVSSDTFQVYVSYESTLREATGDIDVWLHVDQDGTPRLEIARIGKLPVSIFLNTILARDYLAIESIRWVPRH